MPKETEQHVNDAAVSGFWVEKSWKVDSNQKLRDCSHNKFREDWYIWGYPIKKCTERTNTWESLAVKATFPPLTSEKEDSPKLVKNSLLIFIWAN